MNIAATNNYSLMALNGVEDEQCLVEWEKIVKQTGEASGDYSYLSRLDNYRTYISLLAEFNIVKAMLLRLCYIIDDNYISYLRKKGYKIDISGAKGYSDSIIAAMARSNNLVTKIKMKSNEMIKEAENSENQKAGTGFEETLANLCAQLGFEVNDNVTLARFNEYRKIIQLKNKRPDGFRD